MNRFGLYVILFLLVPLTLHARVLYVKSQSPAVADGLSWAGAFASIEETVQAAKPGDSIWVAEGTYRDAYLSIPANIQWIGGFSGTETSLAERDWKSHPTVLDGNVIRNITGPFLLDGFTLMRRKDPPIQVSGSGVAFRNCTFRENEGKRAGTVECKADSSVQFIDCTFEKNIAKAASAVLAVHANVTFERCSFLNNGRQKESETSFSTITGFNGSQILMKNCRMNGNIGLNSGGIFCLEGSTLVCQDSTFHRNHTWKNGGAVSMVNGKMTIERCRFELNRAQHSGGALATSLSNAEIQSSTFSWNRTLDDDSVGGAIYLHQGTGSLRGCVVSNNASKEGGGVSLFEQIQAALVKCRILDNASLANAGGLQSVRVGKLSLDGCTLQGNFCVQNGGGLNAIQIPAIDIRKSQFRDNHAISTNSFGGAVSLDNTPKVNISECTFEDNTLNPKSTLGAGIYAEQCGIETRFSLFRNNIATTGVDFWIRGYKQIVIQNCTLIHSLDEPSNSIFIEYKPYPFPSTEHIRNNIFGGYAIPVGRVSKPGDNFQTQMENNFMANEYSKIKALGFIDPERGNFHLQNTSRLIDAGTGTETIGGHSPYDGNKDGMAVWDAGAFEFNGRN